MTRVLFAARPKAWAEYERPLARACRAAGLDLEIATDWPPETVDFIVYAPNSPVQDFRPYTRLKAVLNLWAGVEEVVHNATLTVPLCRMIETGLTEGMTEWVVGHTLRHHLGMDAHITGQDGSWTPEAPPLARNRPVGVLGLGELGAAAAQALAALGFPVFGWSRQPKEIAGIACHHGPDGLSEVLRRAEILTLLLPLTPETESLMDAPRLAQLPRGAVLLNPGRGGLIDDAALLAALDTGQIGHATLDTFRTEPLPPEHPYWAHPRVTVTPHIASATRTETASAAVAENIRRGLAGLPYLGEVDRARAY